MKICPRCGRIYDNTWKVCSHDDTVLVRRGIKDACEREEDNSSKEISSKNKEMSSKINVKNLPADKKICPKCNELLPEGVDICPQCEVDLETDHSLNKQDNFSKEISSKIDDTVLLGGEIKDACEKEDDSICQNCGKEIAIKSKVKFCPHCGKSIYFRKEKKSPSFYTGETPYHQDKFRCFDEAGQFVPTWNWAAFFFGIFWYLCKGMPAKAGIFLVVGIILIAIPLFFLLPLYFGIVGNYDYYLSKVKGKQLW